MNSANEFLVFWVWALLIPSANHSNHQFQSLPLQWKKCAVSLALQQQATLMVVGNNADHCVFFNLFQHCRVSESLMEN